ncbi:MAG: hypothetical protein J6A22_08325 [Bacteroidales bacterium]|nr:hypothetical protein [Bacteroidales bacterium]
MMRYRIFLTTALMCFMQFWALAQNIDPTVVVSREYEGKLMEVHKPVLEMAVPDSVMSFDLEFDYSVFDNPYRGAYEFKPYLLDMRPSSFKDDSRRLYLNAGAGYQLHPELDLVWAPLKGKSFVFDVYASHHSFFGTYHPLSPGQTEDWKGNDMESKAGIDGAFDWKSGAIDFDLGYYGVAQDDFIRKRGFNAFDASLGFANKPVSDDYFLFDILAEYRFAADDAAFKAGGNKSMTESLVKLDAVMGPVFRRTNKVLIDLDIDIASYDDYIRSTAALFSLVPHYVFKKNRWNLDMGLNVSAFVRPDSSVSDFSEGGQYIYPDVRVEFETIRKSLYIYASAEGGNKLGTYSSLLGTNRHFDMSYAGIGAPLLNNSVKRIDLNLGFKGRVVEKFSYDVKGGYADYKSIALDAVYKYEDSESGAISYVPGISYAPFRTMYVDMDLLWRSESLYASAGIVYNRILGFNAYGPAISPAALSGNVSVEYNWKKRIYGGVDCSFSSSRAGGFYEIPAFADLGLNFEYVFASDFSLWCKAGNLLGMKIQRTPFYAEKGVYFTLGFCLNLQ